MRDIRDMETEAKRLKAMTPEEHAQYDKELAAHRVALGLDPSPAMLDVQAERFRQISEEEWTPEHDDEHAGGEMAKAAACYVMGRKFYEYVAPGVPREVWPWDLKWWKPKGRRRDLVRAAALIIAEIERLDRAKSPA